MRNQAPPRDAAAADIFQVLTAPGCGPREIEQNLAMLEQFRAASPGAAAQVDRLMVEEIGRVRTGLEAARVAQEEIRQTIEELTAPPYFPGVFLAQAGDALSPNAVVRVGGELRAVRFGETDPGEFQTGDELLLSQERNFIVSKLPPTAFTCGETASFVRHAGEGRLVLKSRDEEMVVLAAAALREAPLKAGDLLRFDRNSWMAYERIDRARGDEYFLEETPAETFESVGGLDREIETLKRSIELHFYHPGTVRTYRLKRRKAVLLYGPPGTGKTLIARGLANWLASLSKAGRSRFINVKPAGLHSMWYGQTEANYREVFRIAREAGAGEPEVPVVIFFDEVDSIGAARGRSVHPIDDRVANAFMAELNGLEERGNILVVTATNRLDTLDPGLTRAGRLGDLKLRIPRPGRKAARQIFEKHLPGDIPYAANGHTPERARKDAIDTAVSMIFSPNGDGELAQIMFRDGKRRPVRASELINGAEIASIAQAATERACAREAGGGEGGVQMEDVVSAVGDFFGSAACALTPLNCRNYIDDLPQDVDVVRIDLVERKVSQPYRYVNAPAA
ncbi:MAG: AAA family ATPase [Bryobacteraceae bacterium]|jgi:proteasome-associated ATPase